MTEACVTSFGRKRPSVIPGVGLASEPLTYEEGIALIAAAETVLDTFKRLPGALEIKEITHLRSGMLKIRAVTQLAGTGQ